MMKFKISIIFLSLAFSGSSQEVLTKTFSKTNFSVEYPEDWELTEAGEMGSSFVIFSPLKDENDKFKENVNLIIQDLTGYDLDLAGYTALSISQIKSMIIDGEIISSDTIENDGRPFQRVLFSGSQGNYKLQFEQHYRVINNKAYVITFTAEKDEFEHYHKISSAFLESLKINQ